MNRRLTVLLFLAVLLVPNSCCQKKTQKQLFDKTVSFNKSEINSVSKNFVSGIKYIVFNTLDKSPIGTIDKVIVINNTIYLGDYKSNRIYLFDLEGNLQGILDKHGRGPGEYLAIQSFVANEHHLYIMDQFQNSIVVYDARTLDYQKTLKTPVPSWDFEVLNNGGFVFAYSPMVAGQHDANLRYRVFVTDSNLNIKQNYFPYTETEMDAFSTRHYLSSNGQYIVYGNYNQPGYCLINKTDGVIEENISFKFSGNQSDGGNYRVPYLCNNYIALSIQLNDMWSYCVFDREKSEINYLGVPFFGIIGSFKDGLIGYWQNSLAYDTMIKNGCPKADRETEDQIHNDIPYLVFYVIQ